MHLRNVLKRSFVTGIALIAPLVITFVALRFLWGWLNGFIAPVADAAGLAQYTANVEVLAQVAAAVFIVLFITSLGYLAQRSVGERVFGGVDRAFSLVPVVRVIYAGVRQVSNALMNRESHYEDVVLVEYPKEGSFVIGLVTSEAPDPITSVTGPSLNVFIPNSPNPTVGRMLVVPEENVYEVDMSVRQGIRLLVTTGIGEDELDEEGLPVDPDEVRVNGGRA